MAKLLSAYENFEYTPDMIKESKEKNSGKIILKGILQKSDTLNQNGRIYPKEILEREVRNYQKFIIENRALGECVPPGTQIMTKDGWKNIEDISEEECIYTLNVEKNEIELQKISKKIVLPYEGKMYRFKNHGSYDMTLTSNHKVLIWDKNNQPKKIFASELYEAYKHLDKIISESTIKSTNAAELDNENIYNATYSLNFETMNVEENNYNGVVYCVTVGNGTWLMKSNNHVCWTSNCDHPESSVVNLKNVSHIVREAYFEGNVVYGSIELLDTPSGKILQSLVESGVKLGISSRGVGSTKKQGDYHVVQDDFQLICWDMVSEPSTPSAFMIAEGKDISEEDVKKIFNRSDRIDRILNDILYVK